MGVTIKAITLLMVGLELTTADVMAANWKYYGASEVKKIIYFCFYDRDSIDKLPNCNVRVWTKTIKEEDLLLITKKKAIMVKCIDKIEYAYIPPYALFKDVSFEDSINIILWEEAANYNETKTTVKMLNEIDCEKKMHRSLSISFFTNDGVEPFKPDKIWDYIAPDSNAETLMKILCKGKN